MRKMLDFFFRKKIRCTDTNHEFPIYFNGSFISRKGYYSCAKDTDFCDCKKYTYKKYKFNEWLKSYENKNYK